MGKIEEMLWGAVKRGLGLEVWAKIRRECLCKLTFSVRLLLIGR
jgi:hypothetical protein